MGAGALLSLAFTYGSVDRATFVMLLILLSGALLPLYRAEYLLGLVLAMNWVFGPILPMMVGAVVVVPVASSVVADAGLGELAAEGVTATVERQTGE